MRTTALATMSCAAGLGRTSKTFLLIALILLVQACTNSKLIISPLYNRLDDRMRDAFHEMADFNDEQTAAFEARLGTYHVWHRQSELPQYADLLRTIAQSISSADTNAQDIQRWFDTAEQRSTLIRECHPINFSFELMQSLTGDQLDSIEDSFEEEQEEDRERHAKRTPEESIKRRLRNITKWANRIDMEITATQRAMLLSTFKRQSSLRSEYIELRAQWDRQFFALVRDQANPDFNRDMSAHLNKLWRLLEDTHPEQWQANRDLWKQTALRFAKSMTDEQRATASSWLAKMGSTLDAVSKDKPSFTVIEDPSLGCLVNSEES